MKKKADKENNIIKFPKKLTKLERQVEAILFAALTAFDQQCSIPKFLAISLLSPDSINKYNTNEHKHNNHISYKIQ